MTIFPYTSYAPADPWQRMVETLQREIGELFLVRRVAPRRHEDLIAFRGELLSENEGHFEEIERRLATHGFTAVLRREGGEDVLVAMAGLARRAGTGNPLVNVALFLATIVTTLAAGAAMNGQNLYAALTAVDIGAIGAAALAGAPFALTLMLILGVHELGHYLAARWHGVAATLPYFIPMPFGGLGTLGAAISLRSPMKNRRVLFDIGIAGPIAGFVVALPLLVYGLLASPVVPLAAAGTTLETLGASILTTAVSNWFVNVPAGYTLAITPVYFAAWLGLLLTGLNLLPVGQLDGGHITYALFGERAHIVSRATFLMLLLAGIFVSSNWLFWALLLGVMGLRHAAPLNDIMPLNPWRRLLGYAAIALFVLVLVPAPFG